MAYRVLAAELWQLADEVIEFYGSHWGISAAKVKKDEPVPGPDLGFVPTLHAPSRDHHLVCVEVASTPYFPPLDRFVLACRNSGTPVRLYVAVPENSAPSFQVDLRRARENGVGVLEATDRGIEIVHEALSQSLTVVRPPALKSFPSAMRPNLSQALQTFRNGDPAKGCSNVYDELEALTRKVAAQARKKRTWRALKKGQSEPPLGDLSKVAWQNVAKTLLQHLDAQKLGRPRLSETLLGRVMGITAHRNATGHKPKDRSSLTARDKRLRTRFEEACDLLQEFASAIRRP